MERCLGVRAARSERTSTTIIASDPPVSTASTRDAACAASGAADAQSVIPAAKATSTIAPTPAIPALRHDGPPERAESGGGHRERGDRESPSRQPRLPSGDHRPAAPELADSPDQERHEEYGDGWQDSARQRSGHRRSQSAPPPERAAVALVLRTEQQVQDGNGRRHEPENENLHRSMLSTPLRPARAGAPPPVVTDILGSGRFRSSAQVNHSF